VAPTVASARVADFVRFTPLNGRSAAA
jgi:hypothetical protein